MPASLASDVPVASVLVVEAAPIIDTTAVEAVIVPTSHVSMQEKNRSYSHDMHAYTTIQSDAAKVEAKIAIAQRLPLMSADSDSSIVSTFSSDSECDLHSPFPITKA